ncbi:hypothetical protein [Plebeiibacterium marinum]|uniref:Uncharacterized protein n=1 Tax=Plebeiibacterium marinum TaxID=2992111 RepID=A0AAE3SLB2_9BACT|nr:hypothetical protein [Plebeiobacterium marinum]MCW3807264.1 hypothetical protein [Plebeiobacterium marinum]
MSKLSQLGIIILFMVIMFSCSDKEELIGKWDDNIKLSTKAVGFDAGKDSVVITTKGEGWWINSVNEGDSCYMGAIDQHLIDGTYTITKDFFTIERRTSKSLFVKFDQNNSGYQRGISITLQSGNYFDYVDITQNK